MAVKTQLRAVVKPAPVAPYRFNVGVIPYSDPDLRAKWLAAVEWLRRGKKSKWLLDNVAPGKWRDVFDDQGKASAEA
jgi:hypothetical protein